MRVIQFAMAICVGLAAPLCAGQPSLPAPVADAHFRPVDMDRVRLGRDLFYDKILSGNHNIACATCHHPRFATGDGVALGLGEGAVGRALARVQNATQGVSLGRRSYERGLLTFVWQADDQNRDTISFDVQYRQEGETVWKPLKRGLTDRILVWDTTSVPNGRYVLRVVASDAPSNSPSTALTGSAESTAFDIDNTPPSITVGSVRRDANRTIVSFEIRDADSAVQKAEYSLDGLDQ
jgi:hypothetical protein